MGENKPFCLQVKKQLFRRTLIQSYLSHIPSCFLSLHKIPSSVATKVEKMQRDFFLSRFGKEKRDHLISWTQIYKSKKEGGLGFENISLRNRTSLGK